MNAFTSPFSLLRVCVCGCGCSGSTANDWCVQEACTVATVVASVVVVATVRPFVLSDVQL